MTFTRRALYYVVSCFSALFGDRLLDLVLLPRFANQRFGHDRASHLDGTMFYRHCLDNYSAGTDVGKPHIVLSHRH